jgi:hypothetical protein
MGIGIFLLLAVKALSESVELKEAKSNKDKLDPVLKQDLTERDDPDCTKSNIDKGFPVADFERKDREEPICVECTTDIE